MDNMYTHSDVSYGYNVSDELPTVPIFHNHMR